MCTDLQIFSTSENGADKSVLTVLAAAVRSVLALQGAKLQHGHIPLYVRGDDENARQFPSLHAVQRHMADTGRFKMAWEDNEDEYEEFYNFDAVPMEDAEAGQYHCHAHGQISINPESHGSN